MPEPDVVGARMTELTGVTYSITGLRPASTGHANTTWLADATPNSLAIKVQTSPAYVFERVPAFEPNVLTALSATPVPVPLVVARDESEDLFGSPWFATAFVDGLSPPDDELAGYAQDGWFVEAEPSRRTRIWNSFVDRLADLHSLPAATFGAEVRGGSHSKMLDYWTASLRDAMASGDAPVQEAALGWLRSNAPADADLSPRPCMGDARMANLLAQDGTVVALVDWELAYVGNPRGDIAYHLYMDDRYTRVTGRRLDGLPDAEATWRRWEIHTGLIASDRRYWTCYAATFIAVTATRALRLVHRFDADAVETLNPFISDLKAFIEHET